MGFIGDCCLVRCKLDDDELLCQLAEEGVELAAAAGSYVDAVAAVDFLEKIRVVEDPMIEEMADVELVSSILLEEVELETLKKANCTEYSEFILSSPLMVSDFLRDKAEGLAKAALKLRRARNKKNPTPITEDDAKKELVAYLCGVFSLMEVLQDKWDISRKIEAIKIRKARRWAERLTGGIEHEGIHENGQELLGK